MSKPRPEGIETTECTGCGDEITVKESEYHGGYCRDCHVDITQSHLDRIERRESERVRDTLRVRPKRRRSGF